VEVEGRRRRRKEERRKEDERRRGIESKSSSKLNQFPIITDCRCVR
jgi:hypothetical protein